MQISIKDVLSTTDISYWTFVWYRREGLLPAPILHEKLRGKGSLSHYPMWIIGRINEIERMRRRGLTVAQIKKGLKPTVQEKLAAIIQSGFEEGEGEEVSLSERLTPPEVFKQIAKQVAAGYSGYLVQNYRVKLEKKKGQYRWIITMKMSEGDFTDPPSPDLSNQRKGARSVH